MTEQYTAIDLSARRWAIKDGALADVTHEAALAGICVPVALTCDAFIVPLADMARRGSNAVRFVGRRDRPGGGRF